MTAPWPLERAFVDEADVEAAWRPAEAQAREVPRIEAEHDDPGQALAALVRQFGEAGLLRLAVPGEQGGPFEHVRSTALCLARERLGHASPLADLAFAMQALGGYPIVLGGSAPIQNRWLAEIGSGRAVSAFALTEPDAGTDLGGMTTRARREGDEYVLDGQKVFISNAGVADVYSLFAVTDPDAPTKRGLSAFVVPAGSAGLRTVRTEVIGGHPLGEVHLDGVRVPAEARLGEEGRGLGLALGTLHKLRPTVGAAAVGFAQRALDETVQHVRTRQQFGAPLSDLAVVQNRLADMACEVEAARLLVYRAAAQADRDGSRSEIARTGSMAKLQATESAQRVIDQAVQLHGGRGLQSSSIIARLYEDVRALRIYEGTNDVQKSLIARELLRDA
jgi:acyl-CoA dehydrogenase